MRPRPPADTVLSCLFCRIASKEIPSEAIYESPEVLAFKDIHPQAPAHLLVIPKRHVAGVQEWTVGEGVSMDVLVSTAKTVARQAGLEEKGYRIVINSKADGGQTVDHLHLHVLGGRRM